MKTALINDNNIDFDSGKHCYVWREKGLPVPGVTSILALLNKPALIQWAANMAVEHITNGYVKRLEAGEMPETSSFLALCQEAKTAHRRVSKEAADVGTLAHKFCEQVMGTGRGTMPTDEKAQASCNAFLSWYRANKITTESTERIVFSKRWYYAGQVDWTGSINDAPGILDFKTSTNLYLEAILQLGGYSVAIEEQEGRTINDGWIVRLDKKTGKPTVYHINLTNQIKDAFLRVREAHKLVGEIEEALDGIRKQAA